MRITRATPAGTAERSLAGTYVLLPHGTGAQRKFRQTFTLSLPTGGHAQGVTFLADSRLTLSFGTYEFDALAAGAVESAAVADAGSGAVRLTLPVARLIRRVKVAAAGTADEIRAFRTDGNVTAEDAVATAQHGSSGANLDVVDQRLALRRHAATGADTLSPTQIAQVILQSSAANPRIGIVVPVLGDEAFYLSGPQGLLLPDPSAPTDVQSALVAVLQGLAGRIADAFADAFLPAVLQLQILVESDTPTLAVIGDFDLGYRLLRTRFSVSDAEPKRSLRFAGANVERQTLALEMPRASSISRATLRLAGAMVEDASAESFTSAAAASESALTDDALFAATGTEIASRITLAAALLPVGGTIDVVAPGATAVTLKLYDDSGGQQGSPRSLLAESSIAVERAGIRQRCRFRFTKAPVVGAGPIWLSLTSHDGPATWLLITAATGAVRRRASDGAWIAQDAAGHAASATLFAAEPDAEANAAKGVQVRIGDARLSSVSVDADREYTFAAQAQAGAHSAPTGLASIEIEIATAEKGQLTVFAPQLEYDPPL